MNIRAKTEIYTTGGVKIPAYSVWKVDHIDLKGENVWLKSYNSKGPAGDVYVSVEVFDKFFEELPQNFLPADPEKYKHLA